MSQVPRPLIDGWHETVVSVRDLDEWVQTYREVCGWELRREGAVTPDMLAYWELPSLGAHEAVVGHPDAAFGYVRLVAFDSAERRPLMRSNGQPWETGGWFDLNARVGDIKARFEQFQDRGWTSVSDPVEYDFGPVTVSEWLTGGPDGVLIALIERLQPPLAPEEHPGRCGTHFNSTQIVSDIDAARHFYQSVLGFETLIDVDDEPVMPGGGPNVLGLPYELAATQRWNVTMLKPPGAAGGSVEIISLPGLSGRDFSPCARLPNRGIVGHRFPVDDVDALHAYLAAAGVPIVRTPCDVTLDPGTDVRMMAVSGPDGARLDFFTPAPGA